MFEDDFQSVLRSVYLNKSLSLNRWNANRCYSLRTTYLILEAFQILSPTTPLIFTTAKLFHQRNEKERSIKR